MVPARVARLSPDVLEAVLHHPPPAELGPAPRPVAREHVAEQVRDEQHAAALHVAPKVVERDPPELERARVGRLERGLAFRGRLLLVLVEHVLVAPRELLFQFEAIADREASLVLRTEFQQAVSGLPGYCVVDALGLEYCDSTCQHDHWRRGHKQICKKIHRGGNAEQYNADKKYKEAVAVAAEACARDGP